MVFLGMIVAIPNFCDSRYKQLFVCLDETKANVILKNNKKTDYVKARLREIHIDM